MQDLATFREGPRGPVSLVQLLLELGVLITPIVLLGNCFYFKEL